ncbi:MAG: HD-GYP domain-containing protein, partial [Smithellaceae bacterium]|nr:HD-GYP domain-containing protein [Smithellaceae bacterium]
IPLAGDALVPGILVIYSATPGAFDGEERELLCDLAKDTAYGMSALATKKERDRFCLALEESGQKLMKTMDSTILAISAVCEARDPYTAGHSRRVGQLASAIAAEMSFDEHTVQGISVIGYLHDIGKMVVPADILSKPGTLSDTEYKIIRTHSQVGHDILAHIDFPWPVAAVILQHHERLDGSGYPQGLTDDAILPETRVLAVADVVESMSFHRPYRPSLGIRTALEEITKGSEKLYDPRVVKACLKVLDTGNFTFCD